MKHLIVLILAGIIWIYDTEGERIGYIEKDGYYRIEIFDKDSNRTGHIRKDGDRWYEYDKDWNRTRTYEKDRIIEYDRR